MTQVVRARFVTCARVVPALVCALATSSVAADDAPLPSDSEAAKIDAARQHPVAQPEQRPVYPSEQPPPREQRQPPADAPAPLAPRATTPALAPRNMDTAPVYAGQNALEGDLGDQEAVVAPQAPPPPREETVLAAPDPGYIWAPGYWYWYGGRYVWVGGSWLPPRPGYVYVGARWVHGYNGWVFSAGGWSVGGGAVVYPMYRHSYLWGHPYPGYHYGYQGYYGHPHHGQHRHHGHYRHGGHYSAPHYGYSSNYRRNAPPAYVSPHRSVHHVHPRHSAPAAHYPRGGSRAVHVRPRH
jgi:hypothetical protein